MYDVINFVSCINIVDCIYIVCIIDCIKFAAILTVGTVCARREGEFIYYIIYINPPPRPVQCFVSKTENKNKNIIYYDIHSLVLFTLKHTQ